MAKTRAQQMQPRTDGLTERFLHRRALGRWHRLADGMAGLGPAALRGLLIRARQLRRPLDRVIHEAEYRLALPVIGSDAPLGPVGSDWVWRPDLWHMRAALPGLASVPCKATLGDGIAVFHDCHHSELTLRQIRNAREPALAPYGLRLEVFRFDGSFLSLAIDLPKVAVRGLRLRHLIRLDLVIEVERPLSIFARLNIRHGPNLEQIVDELPRHGQARAVEFDLAHAGVNERRVDKVWIDLIFDAPEMNELILRDVTLSRRPRADL